MDNLREGSKPPSLLTSFLTYQKNRELQSKQYFRIKSKGVAPHLTVVDNENR
jgi:hypothetical protein